MGSLDKFQIYKIYNDKNIPYSCTWDIFICNLKYVNIFCIIGGELSTKKKFMKHAKPKYRRKKTCYSIYSNKNTAYENILDKNKKFTLDISTIQ